VKLVLRGTVLGWKSWLFENRLKGEYLGREKQKPWVRGESHQLGQGRARKIQLKRRCKGAQQFSEGSLRPKVTDGPSKKRKKRTGEPFGTSADSVQGNKGDKGAKVYHLLKGGLGRNMQVVKTKVRRPTRLEKARGGEIKGRDWLADEG